MSKIFTITGNLLAETTETFKTPRAGETARALGESSFAVGGKGINAARVAAELGFDACALCFPAGFSGRRCLDSLSRENFDIVCREIDGETRNGLVCVDADTKVRTTYLGADLPVSRRDLVKLLDSAAETVKEGDALAVCGSFPGWKKIFASDIAKFAAAHGLPLCVDSYGEPLRDLAAFRCEIVKINRTELFGLLELKDDGSEESFENAFKTAHAKLFAKTKYFGVSDADRPAFFDADGLSFRITPPKIESKNCPAGCGDSMFAFLACELVLKKNRNFKDAARRAAEYASDWLARATLRRQTAQK